MINCSVFNGDFYLEKLQKVMKIRQHTRMLQKTFKLKLVSLTVLTKNFEQFSTWLENIYSALLKIFKNSSAGIYCWSSEF